MFCRRRLFRRASDAIPLSLFISASFVYFASFSFISLFLMLIFRRHAFSRHAIADYAITFAARDASRFRPCWRFRAAPAVTLSLRAAAYGDAGVLPLCRLLRQRSAFSAIDAIASAMVAAAKITPPSCYATDAAALRRLAFDD